MQPRPEHGNREVRLAGELASRLRARSRPGSGHERERTEIDCDRPFAGLAGGPLMRSSGWLAARRVTVSGRAIEVRFGFGGDECAMEASAELLEGARRTVRTRERGALGRLRTFTALAGPRSAT